MSTVTPAIIFKMQYDYPSKSKPNSQFKSYLDYIDRDEAKEKSVEIKNEDPIDFKNNEINLGNENLYRYYMDYMGDEKKNGQLFDEYTDSLKGNALEIKRDLFTEAEQKGSPLWESVFSFDNEWLEEQNLYDPKTHWVNENVMKDYIRNSVEKIINNEKLVSPVWTASFHYNTDNIHVHIATVELEPDHLPLVHGQNKKTKKLLYDEDGKPIYHRKGSWKESTFEKAKSTMINQIVDRTKEYKRIDELIRHSNHSAKTIDLRHIQDIKELFVEAMDRLPDDLSQWQYGYNSVDEARPYIDEITEIYLETYHKDEMEELRGLLDEQVEINEKLYGSESNYKQYKVNKLNDLKSKMGNAVLTEMRNLKQGKFQQRKKEGNKKTLPSFNYKNKKNRSASYEMNKAIFQLNKALKKSFHEHKVDRNIEEFDRMLEGYDL